MKRDLDLIRDILLSIEADGGDPIEPIQITLSGHSRESVSYHVQLLAEAGLIRAADFSSADGSEWRAQRLTWAGHEFLDNARSTTVWVRARARVNDTVESVSLETFKLVLQQLVKETLGL